MRISDIIQVDNNYAVVIDNWYNEEEYNKVFEECQFVSNYALSPKDSGAAMSESGNVLKQNSARFISSFFKEFFDSYIAQYSQKLYHADLVHELLNIDPLYEYLGMINAGDSLVSYYENSDYYKAHRDQAIITQLTWLYEQPKSFKGGNLILRDINNNVVKEIECVPNRSIIFPSFMLHEVNNISMDEKNLNQKKGRYTVSTFSRIESIQNNG